MSDAQPIPPLGSTPALKDADNHLPDSVAMSIAYHAQHPEEIDGRLAKLDREWDAAQAAALAASGVSLLGILRASAGRRRWLIPVLGVQCLHLWHTLHGRSDAPSILTKLGLRPRHEIDTERYALKALRGDFQNLPATPEARGAPPISKSLGRPKSD